MRNFFSFIAVSVYLLGSVGCNQNVDNISIHSLGTKIFDIPFEPQTYGMGFLPGNDTNGSYYFSSFKTNKGLAFCDKDGKQIKFISLATDSLKWHSFDGIAVKTRDTIFLQSHLENLLYQLNDTGGIAHVFPLINQWDNHAYNCIGTMMAIHPDRNSVFLLANFQPPQPYTEGIKGAIDRANIRYSGPVLAEMPLDDKPNTAKWHLIGLQQRFNPPGYEGEFYMKYALSKDYIYLYTSFSDSLYKVSIKDNNLVTARQIQSDFTKLSSKPHKITEQGDKNWPIHELFENAIAWNIKYDPYRKLIYLPMLHAVPPSNPPISEDKSRQRKWSLMVFDENLEKIGEFPFQEGVYKPSSIIVTPTELLIQKNDNSVPVRKTIFERFEISLH